MGWDWVEHTSQNGENQPNSSRKVIASLNQRERHEPRRGLDHQLVVERVEVEFVEGHHGGRDERWGVERNQIYQRNGWYEEAEKC